MDKKMIENRSLPVKELRISSPESGGSVLEGHAAVFDVWSETLGGIFPFKERVKRGAFTDSILTDDIRALMNHDPNYVLGRNKSGTLSLAEDETGLSVRINMPDTQWAKDLEVSVRRGDISQMSFGFTVLKDEWREEGGGDVRELQKVRLFDVSLVTFPAYTQTDAGMRGMESFKEYRSAIDKQADELQQQAELEKQQDAEKHSMELLKTKFKNI
jgi:HK97 family phage prohead protease